MDEAVDLTGRISLAIDGAFARGFPIAVAYVDDAGKPTVSVRGSVLVLDATHVGLWARKADSGLAAAIRRNPDVALLFFGNLPDGSRMQMELRGQARADGARNADVYEAMSAIEQARDPDARGIAVVIDVEAVTGMAVDGPFRQRRTLSLMRKTAP